MPFPVGSSLIRLTPDYVFKPFDCGNQDLNDFLLNDSKESMAHLQSVTSILENENEIIAFFSLLNDKISIEDFESTTQWKKFFNLKRPKKKNGYPAMKIGRLAVSLTHQRQNIGEAVMDYLKILFITNNRTGCKFITVDAYSNSKSLNFYQKNGFKYMTESDKTSDTRAMFFDLVTVLG